MSYSIMNLKGLSQINQKYLNSIVRLHGMNATSGVWKIYRELLSVRFTEYRHKQ